MDHTTGRATYRRETVPLTAASHSLPRLSWPPVLTDWR